jgi:hypothetical protein
MICTAGGDCVECLVPAHCGDDTDCTTYECNASNACVTHDEDPNEPCDGGAGICDGAGTCVECIVDGDCAGQNTSCTTFECTGGLCEPNHADDTTPCIAQSPPPVAGTCDGAGTCVPN